jgi:hypothetical protein
MGKMKFSPLYKIRFNVPLLRGLGEENENLNISSF